MICFLMTVLLILGSVWFRPAAEAEGLVRLVPMNQWTNKYTNRYVGYEMQIPASMKRDESALDVRSRFYNDGQVLDIFYDDFRGTRNNFSSYRNYGNKSLFWKDLFRVTNTYAKQVGGKSAKVMYYQRNKLSMIARDKNYYASAEIPRTNQEIITIILKSERPITEFDALLNAFSLIQRQKGELPKRKLHPSARTLSASAQKFMKEVFFTEHTQQFGIFDPSAPDYWVPLDELEKRLDYKFRIIVRYQKMDDEVPLAALRAAKAKGKVVELTLQTTQSESQDTQDMMMQILNGKYADYFKRYAKTLKELDYPVLFRLNNEMNGDWCKYSAYHYGKDADLYIALYRYIFEVFRKERADNVIFVWNPNERSFPHFAWNHAMAYYPGDEYVDVVGLTGYNTGNYYRGEYWRGFEEIYDPLYAEYLRRFEHPMMITEFGSASHGGNKAAWMRDMFSKMRKYPRIKVAIWWSGTDWHGKTAARVYRIDENQETLKAAKEGLSYYKRSLINRGGSLREEY